MIHFDLLPLHLYLELIKNLYTRLFLNEIIAYSAE